MEYGEPEKFRPAVLFSGCFMLNLRYCLCATVLATVQLCPPVGYAIGRWHMPGSLCQYCGHGFGGGHHAPMVRSPGVDPVRVPRRSYSSASKPAARYPGSFNDCISPSYCSRPATNLGVARGEPDCSDLFSSPTPIAAPLRLKSDLPDATKTRSEAQLPVPPPLPAPEE